MKVLGFDGWTVGSHHFERLVSAFGRRGMTLSLVHLGSWGNDVGRASAEKIGSLPVRDISSYPAGSLSTVLDEERPDVVILLSTMTFAHRAFIRYCRARGIPTLNLYHGMTTTWFDPQTRAGIKSSRLGHARFVVRKLAKTFRHTIPCYVAALRSTAASVHDWQRFARDLAAMLSGRHIGVAAEDSRTDACAVYTESEVDHAAYTYGFSPAAVHVVGNPDLTRFGLTDELIGSRARMPGPVTRQAMYIDTGLAPSGLIFAGLSQFIEHLRTTAAALHDQGWQMLLKLHPAQDVVAINAGLEGTGVRLVANDEFISRLQECALSIVENTSLAMVPALMGMPLFFAKYGTLQDLNYGSGLTSYPNGELLTEIEALGARLEILAARASAADVTRWIRANSGPLPAGNMPERVADCVASLATSRDNRT